MIYLYFVILGIVQGLTEFLPVSSSGHLVLLNLIFQMDNFLFVSVILHVATLLAVFVALRNEIWWLVKHPFSRKACLLYVATIPTVIIVLFLKNLIESAFSGVWLPICFAFTGGILLVTQLLANTKQRKFAFSSAIVMGLAQALATLPGISRSGSTICAGLLAGENKLQTTKFSFIMSVPIIIGSLLLEVYELVTGAFVFDMSYIAPLFIAFVLAFIFGVFAVNIMLKLVQKMKLWYFSVYLFILSIICFLFI